MNLDRTSALTCTHAQYTYRHVQLAVIIQIFEDCTAINQVNNFIACLASSGGGGGGGGGSIAPVCTPPATDLTELVHVRNWISVYKVTRIADWR